ncbi:acyltransferase family protein [Curvivirga aplysinae]|uniref:acyltransferase family protein n=1 Tax=Curvivirga aplysinae TaxID=2529852 RepID=UPI0012BD5335|nr:acyltransferase family protein [Curvivirga aplysinae]
MQNTITDQFNPVVAGLRAIAVLLVILFHLEPNYFNFGYIGVDIFFVISGYVITKSLVSEYRSTYRISLLQFYVKRIKRLVPVLICVVFTSLIVFSFLGMPEEFEAQIVSSVYALLGISNFYFFSQGDNYFEQHIIQPFLHTWSLGVEEQFYLLYPILLLLFLRKRGINSKFVSILLVLMMLTSLVCFMFFPNKIVGNFYIPMARLWELGIGCLTYFLYLAKPKITISICAILILLVLSRFVDVVDTNDRFAVIVSCLLTALIIKKSEFGNGGAFLRVLKTRVLVYLGNISYSTYLWHLPVIYVSYLYLSGLAFAVVSFLVTYSLSIVTYHFVEQPFRKSKTFASKLSFAVKYSPVAVILLGFFVYITGPSTVRNGIRASIIEIADLSKSYNIVANIYAQQKRSFENLRDFEFLGKVRACHQGELVENYYFGNCLMDRGANTLVYVFGDSFADQYLPMLMRSSLDFDLMVSTWNGSSFFPSFFSEEQEILQFGLDVINNTKLDGLYRNKVVFLGASFNNHFRNGKTDPRYPSISHVSEADYYLDMEERFGRFINRLGVSTEIILVTTPPKPQFIEAQCIVRDALSGGEGKYDKCAYPKKRDVDELAMLKRLQVQFSNVKILDAFEFFCPREVCDFANENGNVIVYDRNHITIDASSSMSAYFDEWYRANNLPQ